ncbi:MAG: hypothetical protein ACQKBU_02740 [Verrucomicrobiales bacterium]
MGQVLGLLVGLFGGAAGNAQTYREYDSRVEPGPHELTWLDAYERVEIYEDHELRIDGGFVEYLQMEGVSRGVIDSGQLQSISVRDESVLQVLRGEIGYINARDKSVVDLYAVEQDGSEQVLSGGEAIIRLFGGNYGRVYTWSDGGRIEVRGNAKIDYLTAHSGGVILQRNGVVAETNASSTGIVVLDDGSVTKAMVCGGRSTTVIAGGYPSEEIRMFDDSTLLVLHDDRRFPGVQTLRLEDFEDDGYLWQYAGKELSIGLDSGYQQFRISAWKEGHGSWTGEVNLIQVEEGHHVRRLPDSNSALVFFRPEGGTVVQIEESPDMIHWNDVGDSIVGDWNIHVDVVAQGFGARGFTRLRTYPAPSE